MSEQFLATAQVLVRPNTSGFAGALVTEINAAILKAEAAIKPISVPVLAGGGANLAAANQAITQSTKQVAAAQIAGASAAKKAATATSVLTKVSDFNAASVQRLSGVQQAAALTTTELAAKRAILREVNAAAALSERALLASFSTGNAAVVATQASITGLVRETQALAVADVEAAIAEGKLSQSLQARARSEAFAARGAATQGLQLAGLRGATLAANSAFIAGAAGIIALAKSVGVAANLEKQLNVLRVTAGATADEMALISQTARELGADISLPAVSATDAAVAMTELAKAGFSVQDSIEGARGVLLLATAAEIDNANATNIVANALNSFGLAGERATEVADLLAAGSIQAQGSISDMGAALTSAASVSKQVGISLEDTVALLTILAKNGIQGAAGGTALRVALLRLVAPSAAAAAQLEKLGVAIRDSQGRIRPEIFADLEEATRGLTARQRDLALATIFGTRGIRAQVNIARDGVSGLNAMRDAITQGGDAQKLASAQTEGFTGSVENLKNQLEEAGITIGNLIKGPLNLLVKGLALDVQAFNKVAVAVGSLAAKFDDVTQPAQNIAGSIKDAGSSVGTFLDDLTKGIPVLDGFFNTLGEGAKVADTTATVFDRLGASVSGTLDDLIKRLSGLGAAAQAKASAKASPAGVFGKIAGLEEQILGTSGAAERALRQQELAILDKAIAAGNLSIENRRKLKRERERVSKEIESIDSEMASDADAARKKIADAQDKASQAFVDALENALRGPERLAIRADRNESLKDDIKFEKQIIAILEDKKDTVVKVLGNTKAARQIIKDIQDRILVETGKLKTDQANFRKQLHDDLVQKIERIRTGIELDVELADINENTKKRISTREKLIQNLIKERKKLHLTGNALKENRNEIARINAEIKAIKEETAKTGKAFGELAFEFLQTQQGFASNLLGNLIPGNATQGLVGGSVPSGPQQAVAQASAVTQAKTQTKPTAGQANTTNDILQRILLELKQLNHESAHPEAKYERRAGGSNMDVN